MLEVGSVYEWNGWMFLAVGRVGRRFRILALTDRRHNAEHPAGKVSLLAEDGHIARRAVEVK